ncbi:MAG: radical SAM protein [Chloroflexota bacterium]|nr:radical SAM protein [Chloroflexota bacterium]
MISDAGRRTKNERTKSGRTTLNFKQSKSILTPASGFISGFDFTLNPYSGCAFGCTYCYAAFFATTQRQQDDWGKWIDVKENALDLLKSLRRKPLTDKTIYMSSVTDPYQPIERELGLTRALLEELAAHHRVHLVVQTRGTLVTRDADLFPKFLSARVNLSITTDDETVRKVFEPACASIPQRLKAARDLRAAGVPVCITMTPLLPVRDADTFAEQLLATGADRFVVQPFHAGKARFAAGTGLAARQFAESFGWDDARYEQVAATLRARLPNLKEGKAGFLPRM